MVKFELCSIVLLKVKFNKVLNSNEINFCCNAVYTLPKRLSRIRSQSTGSRRPLRIPVKRSTGIEEGITCGVCLRMADIAGICLGGPGARDDLMRSPHSKGPARGPCSCAVWSPGSGVQAASAVLRGPWWSTACLNAHGSY